MMDWVGTIKADIAALQAASGMIAVAGATAIEAQSEANAAAGGSGAFGGEPAGAAFEAMCTRAAGAMGEIATTLDQLSTNTAAAAQGYHLTDVGAVPSSMRIGHSELFPKQP
jgi:uncharacterized protein YukE